MRGRRMCRAKCPSSSCPCEHGPRLSVPLSDEWSRCSGRGNVMGPIDPAAGSALRTPRTSVVRHPERAAYDFETIAAVLDEGLFCHLGFVADGQPYVIPTNYARRDRTLYLHGSPAGRGA